jgi:2-oxoglutarate ferredoxin oxidoreductase subunit alpha
MSELRRDKVAGIAKDIPPLAVDDPSGKARVLVLGWGSTWGAIDGAVNRVRKRGHRVAKTHLVHLSPFPRNLGDIVRRYPRVLIPEMNLGQLAKLVRADFLVDARSVTKVRGLPFTAGELEHAILQHLGAET